MQSQTLYSQCAYCGMCEDGPFAGHLIFLPDATGKRRPYCIPGYTHGICAGCRAHLYGPFVLKKALKFQPVPERKAAYAATRSKQPAL